MASDHGAKTATHADNMFGRLYAGGFVAAAHVWAVRHCVVRRRAEMEAVSSSRPSPPKTNMQIKHTRQEGGGGGKGDGNGGWCNASMFSVVEGDQ